MKKSKRSLVLFSCIIAIAVYTGCSKGDSNDKDVEINDVNYAKGSKKIYVNLLKEYADFTNVAFYDFYNDRKILSYSGNVILDASSYSSTELYILTNNDDLHCISTNVALNTFPSSFKLYTNYTKSMFDTYLKK